LADLEADEVRPGAKGSWTRGPLIRRHITKGEMTCFATWCPAGTPIETIVAAEGHRWAIENSFGDHQERTRPEAQRNQVLAPGTVRNFVCGGPVEHAQAMARVKRSPNSTAN
jgi:hypothetical protein